MRRRITAAIVTVAALAVALFGIPLAVAIHHLYLTDARTKLEREATLAARDVPPDFATSADPIDLPTNTKGVGLGLYDATGALISGRGPARADRAVQEALLNVIRDRQSGDALVAAVPVAVEERVVAVIRAETSIRPAEHRAHLAWALMAAVGALIVGLASAVAALQANRLTRPVRRVRDSAIRLGHGDFTITVPRAGVAELDDLADALTSTARRLGQAMEREQAFSTHTSHQLRTPLAGLRLAVETELDDPRPAREDRRRPPAARTCAGAVRAARRGRPVRPRANPLAWPPGGAGPAPRPRSRPRHASHRRRGRVERRHHPGRRRPDRQRRTSR